MATQILGKVAYTSRGAYDSSFSYEINDVVTYNGSSYVSLRETQGNLPINENYWMLLAQKGDTYEVTSEDVANIANKITEDANSEFNKNVKSQTDAFNTNVTTKTDNFNQNATTKTSTFNTNATSKTDAFDENATNKTTDFDTNAEEKLNEFNENASSYDASIKSNTSRIKRMESNLYDSGVENGSSINIKDSTLAEFQEVNIDGVCEQVTTNGNQLIDFGNFSSVSNGVTYTFENDILSISSIAGTAGYKSVGQNITDIIKNNTGKTIKFKDDGYETDDTTLNPMVQLTVSYSDETANLYRTLRNYKTGGYSDWEIPEDVSNISSVRVNVYANNSANAVANTLTITKPLLYFDDNDTYEPFTGRVASPNPNYPQPISVIDKAFNVKSFGKNILDKINNLFQGTFTSSEGGNNEVGYVNYRCCTKKIDVSNLTGYLTFSGQYFDMYSFYDENDVHISYSLTPTTKIPVGAKSVRLRFYDNSNVLELSKLQELDLMVENKEIATSYEPYQESKIEIPIPDGEFAGKIDDTYKDQFQIKWNDEEKNYHLYLEKNLHKETFNGTESWSALADSNGNKRTSRPLSKKAKIVFASAERSKGISDYFIVSNYYPNDKPGNFVISTKDDKLYIYPLQNSLDEFKDWLSEHNTTVIYPLAEPYTIDLGSVEMLLTYLGQTNVFTDGELNPNMSVKYYREFVATIRNLQVNNGTLQNELADVQARLSALETSLNNLLVSQVESEVVE